MRDTTRTYMCQDGRRTLDQSACQLGPKPICGKTNPESLRCSLMSLRKSLRLASFSVVPQSYCIPHRSALTLARNAAERHYVVEVSLQGLELFYDSVASTVQRVPYHRSKVVQTTLRRLPTVQIATCRRITCLYRLNPRKRGGSLRLPLM
jgi:hypothetical protein